MKEIRAIVRADAIPRVLHALHDCEHFPGVTITPCEGQSRGQGPGGRYIPTEDSLDLRAMRALTILCSDGASDHLIEVIQGAAHTGNAGDGIIIVQDVARLIRIRFGEEQDHAV